MANWSHTVYVPQGVLHLIGVYGREDKNEADDVDRPSEEEARKVWIGDVAAECIHSRFVVVWIFLDDRGGYSCQWHFTV